MTPSVLALLAVAVAVAAFVQGTLGVGFALLLAPLLSFLAPALLPGALLMLMLPLNAWVAWRERAAMDWPGMRQVSLGRVFGGVAGLLVLAALPPATLQVFVGVATILAAVVTLLAPRFVPGRRAFLAAGAVTGVTETATGIGGPPLALVFQHRPAPVLRATVALCFLVGEVFSLLLLFPTNRLDSEQLRLAALLLPPLALGLAGSAAAGRRLAGPLFRGLVLGFAVLSGVACLLPALGAAGRP